MSDESGGTVQGLATIGASRRQMLLGASLGGLFVAASGIAPASARTAITPRRSSAIVSFHRDAPWVDASGQGHPFDPPPGLRGGAVATDLTEETLRRLACYL